MDRGSGKKSPKLDDEMKKESETLERATKEGHAEAFRQQEMPAEGEAGEQGDDLDGPPTGHRIAGTGSSAETYPYRDRGEVGRASHPKPRGDEEDEQEEGRAER